VQNHKYNIFNTSNYLLDGIKVTDPRRIATLNLVRYYYTTFNNQQAVLPNSGKFNPELYKVLYPDAALLTNQEAYVDYIAKRKNNVFRVNNVNEFIVDTGSNTTNFNNLLVKSNLEVLGTLKFNDVMIQGINNQVDTNTPIGSSNILITEMGLREYTETIIDNIKNLGEFSEVDVAGPANLGGDVNVGGRLKVTNSSILTGAATLCNSLLVMQDARFNNNVYIDNNALVYGSMSVQGNMYNSRIGIGYYMDSNNTIFGENNVDPLVVQTGNNTYVNGTYIGFGTTTPEERMHVVGNLKATSNLYALSKIGIGTSNPSYQLQLSQDSAAKPSSTTWTVSSDERLKENIIYADLDRCYEIVKQLPLKKFSWKSDVLKNTFVEDHTKLGWIAQEVETIFPKAVRKQPMYGIEDCRTLDSDQLYASMYGCIQKLQQKIEDLENENKRIKNRLGL
jgi:hypothetical protein